jgi:hypothetical protein
MTDALAACRRGIALSATATGSTATASTSPRSTIPGGRSRSTSQKTALAGIGFESVKLERSSDDWLTCWVGVLERPNRTHIHDVAFHAACGPVNLREAIQVFVAWMRQAGPNGIEDHGRE